MDKKYTKRQIEEAIGRWSAYMLENDIATEEEVEELLGEGKIRRGIGNIGRFFKKAKQVAHNINQWPQKVIDKVFKANDGVKKMLAAMNSFGKSGAKGFDDIKIYANITDAEGKKTTYPIIELALANKKRALVLLIDKKNRMSKPKTLQELRDFFFANKVNPKENIDAILCGEIPKSLSESILLESKLTDYIEKKKWNKKDALKPNAIADINAKVYGKKKGKDYIKTQVEKYFASKPKTSKKNAKGKPTSSKATKSSSSKPSRKEPTAKSSAKPSSKPSTRLAPEPSTMASEPSSEPSSKPTSKLSAPLPSFDGKDPSDVPPAANDMVLYDNDILNVKIEGKAIGFIFGKTQAEIALDKKYAEMFGS